MSNNTTKNKQNGDKQTDEIDLALLERHFFALQIRLDANDDEFNRLFSKGMISKEIQDTRKSNSNISKTEIDSKKFTADPENAENVKKATTLIEEKIKIKKDRSKNRVENIRKRTDDADSITNSNQEELIKFYEEEDDWLYRLITDEFIRKKITGETERKTFYNIVANVEDINDNDLINLSDFIKKKTVFRTPVELFNKLVKTDKNDVETKVEKELHVDNFIKSIFKIAKDTSLYKEDEKLKSTDSVIVKRLFDFLEYILDSLSPKYGEVPYRKKNKENIFINSNDILHDPTGRTKNMPMGIVSIPTLTKIEQELKIFIDDKTVSTDYRYKNIDRLLRCSKRFRNYNSRIILPLFLNINATVLTNHFLDKDKKALTYNDVITHLLNGESILKLIKKDRVLWRKIEKLYSEKNTSELSKLARKTVINNINYLVNNLFSPKGYIFTLPEEPNYKKLTSKDKTWKIKKFSWSNKTKIKNDLTENLEQSFKNINKDSLAANQKCDSAIVLGSNIDNVGSDEESNLLLTDMTPLVKITLYPDNCSSSEIRKNNCKENLKTINALTGEYLSNVQGIKYKDSGNSSKRKRNRENLINQNKGTKLECKGNSKTKKTSRKKGGGLRQTTRKKDKRYKKTVKLMKQKRKKQTKKVKYQK